ncbi:MAG: SPOR domain-containing protein [Tunicatimonas sp.]
MEEKNESLYHLEDTEDFGLHQSEYEPIEREEGDLPPEFQEPTYYSEEEEESEGNKEGIIVAVIIGLLILVGLAVYLFGFGGKDQVLAWFGNDAQVEQTQLENVKTPTPEPTVTTTEESEPIVAETTPAEEIIVEPVAERGATGSYTTIETIATPTGRSYVIVGSFVDSDMARDLGEQLSERGVGIRILAPTSRAPLLHRVAVADYDTFSDAVAEVDAYKIDYGESVWVLKY